MGPRYYRYMINMRISDVDVLIDHSVCYVQWMLSSVLDTFGWWSRDTEL